MVSNVKYPLTNVGLCTHKRLCTHKLSTGEQLLPIFIDLVSTNILLAMLGFPFSQKRHADFCFKLSGLFFNEHTNGLYGLCIDIHKGFTFNMSLNFTTFGLSLKLFT